MFLSCVEGLARGKRSKVKCVTQDWMHPCLPVNQQRWSSSQMGMFRLVLDLLSKLLGFIQKKKKSHSSHFLWYGMFCSVLRDKGEGRSERVAEHQGWEQSSAFTFSSDIISKMCSLMFSLSLTSFSLRTLTINLWITSCLSFFFFFLFLSLYVFKIQLEQAACLWSVILLPRTSHLA